MPPTDLTDKPIAITGASSGIGAATAIACARAGMPVALLARRADQLEQVAQSIRDEGGRAETVVGDVTDPAACEALAERTVSAFGSIYAVYANAGYRSIGPVLDHSDEQLRDIFEVNLWGTLNTIRPAVERMRSAGAGHVLICSSSLSKLAMPFVGPYCATKAAQDHLGRALRHELRPAGIRVSTIHPIGTRTAFFDTDHAPEGHAATGDAPQRPPTTPDAFMQPPETVAAAIVRCLRRPRGEVWTSRMTRAVFALATLAPGLADRAIAAQLRKGNTPR